MMAWDTNPLYSIMHEAIYCQGAASNWAAHRVRCAGWGVRVGVYGWQCRLWAVHGQGAASSWAPASRWVLGGLWGCSAPAHGCKPACQAECKRVRGHSHTQGGHTPAPPQPPSTTLNPPRREAEYAADFDAVALAKAGKPVMFTGGRGSWSDHRNQLA